MLPLFGHFRQFLGDISCFFDIFRRHSIMLSSNIIVQNISVLYKNVIKIVIFEKKSRCHQNLAKSATMLRKSEMCSKIQYLYWLYTVSILLYSLYSRCVTVYSSCIHCTVLYCILKKNRLL